MYGDGVAKNFYPEILTRMPIVLGTSFVLKNTDYLTL